MQLSEYTTAVEQLERGEAPEFYRQAWPAGGVEAAAFALRRELEQALWRPWARAEAFALAARCRAVEERESVNA